MDKCLWEKLKEVVIDALDTFTNVDNTSQLDLNAIKDKKVAEDDDLRVLALPELQNLAKLKGNGIEINYIAILKSSKTVELNLDFEVEPRETMAKIFFPYDCTFGDLIRMIMRL